MKEFRLYKDHGGEFHFPGLKGLHLPPPPLKKNPKLMRTLKETAAGCPCLAFKSLKNLLYIERTANSFNCTTCTLF